MLDPDTLLLIGGLVLVIIGVIGGGLKVKEIAVPKIGKVAQVIAVLIGLCLVLMSFWDLGEPEYPEDETEEFVEEADSFE